jgi:hypothetical protein
MNETPTDGSGALTFLRLEKQRCMTQHYYKAASANYSVDPYQKAHSSKVRRATHLPPEIGKLSQLQDLIVSGCSLTELRVPEEIGGLPKIRHLYLSRCMNLPPQIVKLETFEDLDLSFCQLEYCTCLHILGKLSSLRLDLSGSKAFNDLSEEEYAPMGIGELLAIEYLDLSHESGWSMSLRKSLVYLA